VSVVDADVLVVGAGAIGGVTAALMADRVRRVMVLDANREHVAALRDPGLRLDRLGEESTVRLDAYADPNELPARADFALITLKAAYLEAALTPLVERERAETFVSLGNGLVQDRIAELVGAERLLIGTVEWGATNLGPGHLAQTTQAPFVIGEPDGSDSDRVRRLAEVLGTAADATADRAVETMMSRLSATKASMLQDLERGVPCEVDVINGAVVERGREHGVPTPLNAAIVELVHGYERGDGRPSPDAFETLAQ
jgi:2-dehydropantoate 2-reductase